ncbi:MAG: hypothetical protein LJE83_06710 [Gammaproteobacteria bacterium]|nr:hypothetical protein [Gammaproteobacteria bacterium]
MSAGNNIYKYIASAAIITLLFAPPLHLGSLWWRELINSGHTILFVFLSFIIYAEVKARAHYSSLIITYIYVVAIGFLLGIAIELLQTMVQREASLADIYGNVLGILAGLCLHASTAVKNIPHRKIIAIFLVIGGASFFLAGMTPLMRLSWDYLQRFKAFPVIMDIDASWCASFMHYDKGEYPGISIIEPEPDWSGYRTLNFSVKSDNDSNVNVVLRVHDKTHNLEYSDRFNMNLTVQHGYNEFEIPLNVIRHGPVERELDMKHIAGITLYSTKFNEWMKILVSNITLK